MMPAWMQRLGRRRTVAAGCALVVAAGAVALAQSRDPADRNTPEWAARHAGSLDSSARTLLDQGSAEPVVLGIRASRRFLGNDRTEPVDEHIAFRLPAAAFTLFDLDRGGQTNQRIGWEVFSRTLDPVRLDRQADLADCPPEDARCRAVGPPNSRLAARRASGEYILRIEVTGVLRTGEERQRVLWGISGMREHLRNPVHGPCAFQHDPGIDMLVTDEPTSLESARACGILGYGSLRTRDGQILRAAQFLKLEPDGSARFVVRCMAYVTAAPDLPAPFCELQGYLGQWPLFMWVPSNRAAEWNETFLRVRDHLAHHVVSRSD
jgi:hypothetical protein